MKQIHYLFALLFILIISCECFSPIEDDFPTYSDNPVIIRYDEEKETRVRLMWELFREEYNIGEDDAEFNIEPVTSQFRNVKFCDSIDIFPFDFAETPEEEIRSKFIEFYEKWMDLFGADYVDAKYINVSKHSQENEIGFRQRFFKGDRDFYIANYTYVSFRFTADGKLKYVHSTAIPDIRIKLPKTYNIEKMLGNIKGKTLEADGKTRTITDEYKIYTREDNFAYYAKYEEDRVLVYLLVQITASKYLDSDHSLNVHIYCHPETAEVIYFDVPPVL